MTGAKLFNLHRHLQEVTFFPGDLKSPGAATALPIAMTFTYQNFVLVKGIKSTLGCSGKAEG